MKQNLQPYVFPGIICQEILDLAISQIPYMRTAQFSDIVLDCQRLLLEFINCKNGKVIFGTCSGTAAMDAVVANYVTTKQKPMVLDGGAFGHRWSELCTYYNIKHSVFNTPYAENIDYNELETQIINSHIDVLLCQHHETSSGQLHDIKKISDICKRHSVKLVVDVISSFLIEDFDMNELDVSIAITSSQKGLNIPPGLALIFLSEDCSTEQFAHNNYYLDFQENLNNLTRGQTPYSPATQLFLQLHERLKIIKNQGLETHKEIIASKAKAFRRKCVQYGWVMPCQTPSNCVTGFFITSDIKSVLNDLIAQGIYIMPGGQPNYLRVSHTGDSSVQDLECLADTIYNTTLKY